MTIKANWKVWIGTAAPTQKFEVNGNIKLSWKIINEAQHYVWEDWEPAFVNGWVNYWGWYQWASFIKDKNWFVNLYWLVKDWSIWDPIFSLPNWYKPASWEKIIFAIQTYDNTIWRLDVNWDWVVIPVSWSNSWFSLSWVSFYAW